MPATATIMSLCVFAAFGVLFWTGLRTTSARVAAATDAAGSVASGTIILDLVDRSHQIMFENDNLFPGRTEQACVELRYHGSIPGTIRVFAAPGDSTGLAPYLALRLATAPHCGEEPATAAFTGRLSEFFADHDRYDTGVVLGGPTSAGQTIALHGALSLVDDNDAQGREVDFSLIVEVRPVTEP